MKHIKNKKHKQLVIYAVAILIIISSLIYFSRDWLTSNYYRVQAERTLRSQINPLQNILGSMGFNDLNNLNTSCKYTSYEKTPNDSINDYMHPEGGKFFECTSGVSRYIKLPTGKAAIQNYESNVSKLSDLLASNGWESRKDYPTKEWFHKILAGVDYQPDQYNQKRSENFNCTIDFFTSFSKLYKDSQQPAVTLNINCSKSDQALPQLQ